MTKYDMADFEDMPMQERFEECVRHQIDRLVRSAALLKTLLERYSEEDLHPLWGCQFSLIAGFTDAVYQSTYLAVQALLGAEVQFVEDLEGLSDTQISQVNIEELLRDILDSE